MRRFRPKTWQLAALALAIPVVLGAPRQLELVRDIPIGTGYTAAELCTRTLYSGDEFARVRDDFIAPKVRPLPKLWRLQAAAGDTISVTTILPLPHDDRAAIFRPGLGCTVVPPGASVAAVSAQSFVPVTEPPASNAAWPRGEGPAETDSLTDAQRAVLDTHARYLFADPGSEPAERQNTLAFLVAKDGRLVYERYADGYHRDQPQPGWSMTKTLTAMLAGVMAGERRLALDEPVALPQWQGSPKARITWRHLLQMAPGLAWNEDYRGLSDVTAMLYSQPDQGTWAADRPLIAEPGTKFTYSTGFSNIAMLRMRQLLGGEHQAIYDYYQTRLFEPLGIRGGVIEPDAAGTPVGGARGILRPIDWLRLGQLIANHGNWEGEQIIPADFVDFLLAPSPASPDYGGSIWRAPSARASAKVKSRLPDDLVFFQGHMGQFVVVVPSRALVVVRMGVSFTSDHTHETVFAAVADLIEQL